MTRRLLIVVGVALVAALTIPSLAAAHTGSVSCSGSDVRFAYNANFASTTSVVETVTDAASGNSVLHNFTVPAHTATSDTITGAEIAGVRTALSITARASWSDNGHAGSIGPVTLTCPPVLPSPPPVTTVCPEGTTQESSTPGMLVCVRTVTTPAPAVTVTTPGPAIDRVVIKTVKVPARQGKCPKFTRRLSKTGKPLVCGKDVVKWRTPKATPRRTPIHRGTGVTG